MLNSIMLVSANYTNGFRQLSRDEKLTLRDARLLLVVPKKTAKLRLRRRKIESSAERITF